MAFVLHTSGNSLTLLLMEAAEVTDLNLATLQHCLGFLSFLGCHCSLGLGSAF